MKYETSMRGTPLFYVRCSTEVFWRITCVLLLTCAGSSVNDVIELTEADRNHFDHVIMTYMRERHIPGASVAVSAGGQFLVRKGFGKAGSQQMVSPWSLFRLGSVSKAVTTMGVLRLYQEGRLQLADRVLGANGLLKQYELPPGGDSRLHDVTVLHLLRHTAGWNHSLTGDPLMRRDLNTAANQSAATDGKDRIIRYMMGQKLHYDPGTRFSYSNFGYLLLGRVIEAVTGLQYSSYIRGLLGTAGVYRMRLGNTSRALQDDFEVEYFSEYPGDRVQSVFPSEGLVSPPYGGFCLENMDSSSGWIGTAADVVQFYEALNGTGSDGTRLLNAETFRLMISQPESALETSPKAWYGMGVVVQDGGRTFWHSGHLEGSTALASRDESGLTWAILTNYKVRNLDFADVMRYAIHRFHRRRDHVTPPSVELEKLSSYVHTVSDNGDYLVKLLIPEYKMKETLNTLSQSGYRATWLDAVEYYGIVYFNTIWTKTTDKSKWKLYFDLSPSRYNRRYKAKVNQGYRLAFIETYTQRRRLRYAAVFVRDGWPPWETYHGYSPHQHKEKFFQYLAEGYHLTVQSVTEYRDKVYVAALYEKIYLGDIRVRMGLTESDLGSELNTQISQGRILSYMQAYERQGQVKFSAIWIPQTTFEWAVSKSMSKYTLLYKLQLYATHDVPLTCVTSYLHDDTLHFAALWL